MWRISTGIHAQLKVMTNFSRLIPTDESMNWVRFALLITSFQVIVIVWGNYLMETEDGNYLIETEDNEASR